MQFFVIKKINKLFIFSFFLKFAGIKFRDFQAIAKLAK